MLRKKVQWALTQRTQELEPFKWVPMCLAYIYVHLFTYPQVKEIESCFQHCQFLITTCLCFVWWPGLSQYYPRLSAVFCGIISTFISHKRDALIVGAGLEWKWAALNERIPVIFQSQRKPEPKDWAWKSCSRGKQSDAPGPSIFLLWRSMLKYSSLLPGLGKLD